MNGGTRRGAIFLGGIVSCLLLPAFCLAETWSDKSGQYQIEAEYAGVEGRSVVLRKADGTTIKVPIDKLSDASRAQAKRLYELANANPAPATAAAANLNFTPPAPPTVPPMAAFPENASLQVTFDYFRAQVLAGHPEVFWHALPQEMRDTLDSSEFRSSLTPMFEDQAQNREAMEKVAMKLVEVLVTKKQFVLNSPLLEQVPPPLMPTVEQAYDPAVGLVYELSRVAFGTDTLTDKTITQMVDYHGPRIGAHLASLARLTPPGMIDGALSQVTVEQSSDNAGTITAPDQQGGMETTEMVRYMGRWLPKDFADKWAANKDGLTREIAAQISASRAQDPQAVQQANFMIAGMVGMAEGLLGQLLAANTQQEFDLVISQVAAMIPMPGPGGFGPPGAPGGPPPGGEFGFGGGFGPAP